MNTEKGVEYNGRCMVIVDGIYVTVVFNLRSIYFYCILASCYIRLNIQSIYLIQTGVTNSKELRSSRTAGVELLVGFIVRYCVHHTHDSPTRTIVMSQKNIVN
jgi:hypothetical protein